MATEYILDADKIAHWRIDNHVPLKQLARAAGVNLSSLGHAIRDGREVKMNLLLNLAEAMGEDPRDIVRPKDRANEKAEGRRPAWMIARFPSAAWRAMSPSLAVETTSAAKTAGRTARSRLSRLARPGSQSIRGSSRVS